MTIKRFVVIWVILVLSISALTLMVTAQEWENINQLQVPIEQTIYNTR